MEISKIYYNNTCSTTINNFVHKDIKNMDNTLLFFAEQEYLLPQSDNDILVILKNEKDKLTKLTNKYNLVNVRNTQSEILKDAQLISNEFIKTYGELKSLSREEMMLINHPNLQPRNSTRKIYNQMCRETKYDDSINQQIKNKSQLVKKYKSANCGECTMILNKMTYDKFKDKYNIYTINYYATVGNRGVAHLALLLSSKDGTEEYVIDPWIDSHNGGVFKKRDWENIIAKAYQINQNAIINIFTSDSIFKSLKEEEKYSSPGQIENM